MFKKSSIILLLLVTAKLTLFGQETKEFNQFANSFWFGADLGPTFSRTDYENTKVNIAARLSGDYFFNSTNKHLFGLKLFGGAGYISGKDDRKPIQEFTTSLVYGGLGFIYSYEVAPKFYPYAMIAPEFVWFEPNDKDGNLMPYRQKDAYKHTQAALLGEIGLKYLLNEKVTLNFALNYDKSFSDDMDDYKTSRLGLKKSDNDDWAKILVGVSYRLSGKKDSDGDGVPDDKDACPNTPKGIKVDEKGCPVDSDGDGLNDEQELNFGTNPNNPDSDGDGLKDGEEIYTYKTNPLVADSDNDSLTDGDEVLKFKTDPLKTDTDGDGLSDFDELMKYKTNPLIADTDKDGLSDGDEVLKYLTNPRLVDTDFDMLSDGDEVLKYKTNPLKADTDGGSLPDGKEIEQNKNPLDPNDDVDKPKAEKPAVTVVEKPNIAELKVGSALELKGIQFKSGKATILPESEASLNEAVKALKDNPAVVVEVRGYTDNQGKAASNIKISKQRADAVKAYLVKKGISAKRVTAKGLGPVNPVAPNETEEGRAKNRRIEFFRVK